MTRLAIGFCLLWLAVGGGRPPSAAQADRQTDDLQRLYGQGTFTPIWTDETGHLRPRAHEALALLQNAASDGLDPAGYDVDALARLATEIDSAPLPSGGELTRFDRLLSGQILRYFRHLHLGRVDPRTIGFKLSIPVDQHDFVQVLRDAVAADQMAVAVTTLAPQLVLYRSLRAMLARYRTLAADASLEPLPPSAAVIHPGDTYPALEQLRRQLAALGDLPPDTAAAWDAALYDGPIVDGVERFQARHGLEPDGVIGKTTLAALQVPLAWRVRQIELALERLRWLPDLGARRFLALNIPMFQLWGWDSITPTGEPTFGMRAIVGRAIRTQTPIFVEDMEFVIFRPYWNVPTSILRGEILPKLATQSGYADQHQLEMVRGDGDDAQRVDFTPEHLALLREGVLRLRQRPGPNNSLGLIKFMFPNDDNVYLHGTPATELFARTRRDFSHGCVRVEDPVALAEWALKGDPEWTRERIIAATEGSSSRRVDLAEPIQVILFYLTAVVMPEDGTAHFADDIYGHDRTLDRALTRQQWPIR